MKKALYTLITLLMISLLAICITLPASAADVVSGTWGALSWSLNQTTGSLTVSGTGQMPDFVNDVGEVNTVDAWQSYKDSIQSVTVENGVTNISVMAFAECTQLTGITLPASLTSIEDCAFYGCAKLNNVTIPSHVTNIGVCAFGNCTNLTSVTLPNSVTSIGGSAFENCSALTSVTLPNGITRIHEHTFGGCKKLNGITIPSSVKSIGIGAFQGCATLTSITIPKGVTGIGNEAFSGCANVTSLTVDPANTVYRAVGNCLIKTSDKTLIQGFASSVVPTDGSVTSIGKGAFAFCKQLTHISIPDGVKSIGEGAFYECTRLASVTVPKSVTTIGNAAFEACNNLTAVTYCGTDANISRHFPNATVQRHAWNDGAITTPATHVTTGEKTYTCTLCAASKTETIAKNTSHTYGAWQTHDANQHKRVCACGDTKYESHAWNDGTITTPPTHLAQGVKTYACTVCGEAKQESIGKTDAHSFGEWQKHDETQHKRHCECGETEYGKHTYANDIDPTCDTCDALRASNPESDIPLTAILLGALIAGGILFVLLLVGVIWLVLSDKKKKR